MKVYEVKRNQNIFDVAVYLYGSVEGIFDLMANNDELSFETKLQTGDKLYYDEKAIVYPNIVREMEEQGIVPANGERHVYFKHTDAPLRCYIVVPITCTNITLDMAGDGDMIVDWGDNTDLETIHLTPTPFGHSHYFDNKTDNRKIKLCGNFNIKSWNLSLIKGEIYPIAPITVDEVSNTQNNIGLQGLFLFDGTYSVNLSHMHISTLESIRDMSLRTLELTNIEYDKENALDDYLIYIAKNNNQRRNCTVTLDHSPSGVYREPLKDQNGNYIIASGMEAIYVILHEPEWNQAGPWRFIINGKSYEAEVSAAI